MRIYSVYLRLLCIQILPRLFKFISHFLTMVDTKCLPILHSYSDLNCQKAQVIQNTICATQTRIFHAAASVIASDAKIYCVQRAQDSNGFRKRATKVSPKILKQFLSHLKIKMTAVVSFCDARHNHFIFNVLTMKRIQLAMKTQLYIYSK